MHQQVKIEEEFNLPFGFGFDYIIKEKADLINNKKFKNNKLMDNLVDKLGFIDYRDALAANKYILDAKRHGDYHQQARAKTLALAMSKMSKLRREQIDKAASDEIRKEGKGKQNDKNYKEEKKLKMVKEMDGVYAHVYDAVYDDVKSGTEKEMNELK